MSGKPPFDAARKPTHSKKKKKKSRTEVPSSESDSDVPQQSAAKSRKKLKTTAETAPPTPADSLSKSDKKAKSKQRKLETEGSASHSPDSDTSMVDAEQPTPNTTRTSPSALGKPQQGPMRQEEDFTSIYLRKVTAELGDDIDKVREANDFTQRSLPMLIHALKQGESIFSAEEKRRVVSAVNA